MSDIDFQNGFICGMATKGLVRSGQLYQPLIWNDDGVYDYFYIDFRRAMEPFSLGMFDESIIVHDSVQLAVTAIVPVYTGIYKLYCNISSKKNGITVLNKKTSLLQFASGERLPVFSTHMYILGQDSYLKAAYVYDLVENFSVSALSGALEFGFGVDIYENKSIDGIYDEHQMLSALSGATESTSVVLV